MIRINIHGGPGVGKTTTSHGVYADLKKLGYNGEFVQEHVKLWAWQNKRPDTHDQVFLFAMQHRAEYEFAKAEVPFIVSECPLLTCVSYSKGTTLYDPLSLIAMDFEKMHPSINILLSRKDGQEYVEHGRFETPSEAVDRDHAIRATLNNHNMGYFVANKTRYDEILEYALKGLNL